MRFMVLVKANEDSEAGILPDEAMLVAMGRFNEELVKAGVLLAGEGLQSSAKGTRIRFPADGGKPVVTDGPFSETKELIAGFWLIQAKSMEEALEWFSRAPFRDSEIEVRQLFEAPDFEPSIKTEAGRAVMDAEQSFRNATSG